MGNDKAQKRKVQITSIITLFVFLVDIYLIIYVPADYILATAAFVTLVSTIFTLNSWFKLKEIENLRREEHYTDIMKAEKGTYVITLEMLKDLDQKINFIGQKIMPLGKVGDENQRKIAAMLDSIVEDQKKIAKITISRSKENADALMNSNDKLLVQMTSFRDTMENIRDQISKQIEASGQESAEFGDIKNELIDKIQTLTESIKKEVDEISENIEISNQSVESLISASRQRFTEAEMAEPIETETIPEEMQMPEPTVTEAIPEMPVAEEPMAADSVPEEPMAADSVPEEPVIADAIPEESVISESMAAGSVPEEPEMPNQIMEEIPEEEAIPESIQIDGDDIISELLMEKKSLDDAVLAEESLVEESVMEPEMPDPNKPMSPEDIAALLANTTMESPSESVAEPVKEEPPMPDMTDPNKPMSPEDIAALIANTAAEDLPDETEKFEEEEKLPMPDMTDPNKPMSPEDIAALIANM